MRLPPGAQTKIAKELGVSRQFVSAVLAGKKTSDAVMQAAGEQAELWEREQLRNKLRQLSKNELIDLLMQHLPK